MKGNCNSSKRHESDVTTETRGLDSVPKDVPNLGESRTRHSRLTVEGCCSDQHILGVGKSEPA